MLQTVLPSAFTMSKKVLLFMTLEKGSYSLNVLKIGCTYKDFFYELVQQTSIAQCAFCQVRWPCGQNGPVYATGPYYVAHVVDTGP